MTEKELRQLDAEIAEKVMGWTHFLEQGDYRGGKHNFPRAIDPLTKTSRKIPNFSTNISAAWEVVEKLKEQYSSITISWRRNAKSWICAIGQLCGPFLAVTYAETISEAICLAALEVVKGD